MVGTGRTGTALTTFDAGVQLSSDPRLRPRTVINLFPEDPKACVTNPSEVVSTGTVASL
jgi:hypothetical protein